MQNMKHSMTIAEGTNLYACSDLHFSHKNILRLTGRPFSGIEEMNEALIANWNSKVREDDIVFYLGDFSWKKTDMGTYTRLNGKKVYIVGNHDDKAFTDAVQEDMNTIFCGDYLFTKITYKGKKIEVALMHYPIEHWYKKQLGAYHIHGHMHGNVISKLSKEIKDDNYPEELLNQFKIMKIPGRMDAAVDGTEDYAPILLDSFFGL